MDHPFPIYIPKLFFLFVVLWISQWQFGSAGEDYWKVSCIKSERDALLQFRESLTDESNRLSSWSGEDCCAWKGVQCSNSTGHVLKLDLHNPVLFDFGKALLNPTGYLAYFNRSCLGGQLNPSLATLKFLQYLDLSSNNFLGNEVPTFLELLKDLRYLNLSNSGFAGKIPNELGNLSRLQYLDLSENSLTTENLWWVARLTSLRVLFFSTLPLGDIQDWLRAFNMLPSLKSLELYECELTSFPDLSHVNLTSLTVLELGYNNFYTIPPLLRNFTALQYLGLSFNNLTGSSDDVFQKMTFLVHLHLSHNPIRTSFSKSWCNMSDLSSLDLSDNHLQGSIPSEIGHRKKLITLDLSFNNVNGAIPFRRGMLTELQELSIHGNTLSGVLSELHVKIRLQVTYCKLARLQVRLLFTPVN